MTGVQTCALPICFEALTISAPAGSYEPFRLFVATEGPLYQDLDIDPDIPFKNRWLHYLIDPNQYTLLSEHVYTKIGRASCRERV